MSNTPLKALHLEDDPELQTDFGWCYKEANWEITFARSVEKAIQHINVFGSELSLLIVDMMVPRTEEDADKLADAMAKRSKKVDESLPGKNLFKVSAANLLVARVEVEAVDWDAVQSVQSDGGIEYLKQVAQIALPNLKTVLILTARDIAKEELQSQFSEVHRKSLHAKAELRFQGKPIEGEELLSLLQQIEIEDF